jgi:phosphatidylethanolamine/phosphatidyl-N-methylethanolamine N-methyltransferase
MRPFLHFFWAALKNPLQVSTLFQTGPTASQLLTDAVPEHSKLIVELGVGTGAITQSLLTKVDHPDQYLGIELNSDLIGFAQERFPTLKFVNDSAENFAKYLKGQKVSAVVSSLPWTVMPQSVVANVIQAVHDNLQPGGVFTTYLTVHVLKTPAGRRMQMLLQEKFTSLDSKVVFENLPPAKIFVAKK